MYFDFSVIANGGLDEETSFKTQDEVDAETAKVLKAAMEQRFEVEVYVLRHDHSTPLDCSDGCECVQYEQDLRPYAEFHPETVAPATSEEG